MAKRSSSVECVYKFAILQDINQLLMSIISKLLETISRGVNGDQLNSSHISNRNIDKNRFSLLIWPRDINSFISDDSALVASTNSIRMEISNGCIYSDDGRRALWDYRPQSDPRCIIFRLAAQAASVYWFSIRMVEIKVKEKCWRLWIGKNSVFSIVSNSLLASFSLSFNKFKFPFQSTSIFRSISRILSHRLNVSSWASGMNTRIICRFVWSFPNYIGYYFNIEKLDRIYTLEWKWLKTYQNKQVLDDARHMTRSRQRRNFMLNISKR